MSHGRWLEIAKQLLPATIQCLTEALCVFVCDCWNFKDLLHIPADMSVLRRSCVCLDVQ